MISNHYDYSFKMTHVPEIITINRPVDILNDEVIVKTDQPPEGYPICYELDIITKKQVDDCPTLDSNLL